MAKVLVDADRFCDRIAKVEWVHKELDHLSSALFKAGLSALADPFFQDLCDRILERASLQESAHLASKSEDWQRWVRESFSGGTRQAH
eukprot:7921899-Pyramimonas_sp.AAC.1